MTRRTFLILTAAAGAGAIAGASGRTLRGARFSSANGLLTASIEAGPAVVPLAGSAIQLYGFNGLVPGPALEARAGDLIRLAFHNNLPEPTNLHYHGLHVPPTGRADNVFLEIPPGERWAYEFTIPRSHPAGLFWYHPHLHGRVARQVGRGLAAPFIVRGELDAIPEVAAAREHILVLQDFDVAGNGAVREPGMMERMQGREGWLQTTSGQEGLTLPVLDGSLLRLRLLNASPSRHYRLAIEQHPMHLIAGDGGGLPAPQALEELLLAPGERADVLVSGGRREGSFRLLALPYDRGRMGMGMGGGMGREASLPLTLATIQYQGRAARTLPLPTRLITVDPLPAPVRVRRFVLGMSMGRGVAFTIDGRQFDHHRVDTAVRLGDVEEWEYVNTMPMDHPMHLHTNAFQIVSPGGGPERSWKDVVQVKRNSWARVRVAFRDFEGRTVQHCHILDHEDLGMMSLVEMRPSRGATGLNEAPAPPD